MGLLPHQLRLHHRLLLDLLAPGLPEAPVDLSLRQLLSDLLGPEFLETLLALLDLELPEAPSLL